MKKTILMKRILFSVVLLASCVVSWATTENLRRPISTSQPAWIIHIDVWNYADPQKVIDMVPEDVRPYVIFNIATSSSDEKSPNGPNIYESWMKVCAQNRVWTMIQCSSGATNRLPDTPNDLSEYEKYFKDYPNFIGFNFAEQYWGFDSEGSVTFDNRLQLFANLLTLCKTYGGYLAVSFADSYHNANKMPVAWMKRNADINTFLSSTPEHFICFEKYTQKKNFLFNESHCLGAWLSGFAGSYGIRFDSSGWVENGVKPDMQEGDTQYTIGVSDFVRAAGAIPVAEHMMLTGQTIMDGPELSWTECSTEGSTSNVDGYTRRNWEWKPQWNAITLDWFRKILDGTVRIPSKEEVMARTKVCVVNGGSGTSNESYRIPTALYDGLYRNKKDYGGLQNRDDNHWLNNRWWMKSTGRYPTIPDMLSAGTLTDISGYIDSKESKVNYLNSLFPEEYTGTIYAGRHENGWVTYNPFQYDDVTTDGIRTLSKSTTRATGNIPFQYNTCTSVDLDYAPYSLGIMKEYANKVTFYLQNYEGGTDVIKINGASTKPTYTANGGNVTESWADNIYTLIVEHSGAAVELSVNCSGSATERQTNYTAATIVEPEKPAAYTGELQYEAELADYKSVTVRKSGYGQGHDDYMGQGYSEMTSESSALRFHVKIPESAYYLFTLRYQADAAGSVTLSAGETSQQMDIKAVSEWKETCFPVLLEAGEQTIDLSNTGGQKTYVDCIKLEKKNIAHFKYNTVNGEYHVDFAYLTCSGNVTFDAVTGVASVPAKKSGALTLLLDAADFSNATRLTMSKTGGDVFNYLTITDADGNKVNDGNFWSSKYNLDYTSHQSKEASKKVYKLEWIANTQNTEDQSMTITDIVVKVDLGTEAGIINESNGTPAVIPSSVESADITYTRMLTSTTESDVVIEGENATLYTVCLPYQPTTGNGLKYYTLSGVNDDALVFTEVSSIVANTPYLVAVTSGSTNVGNGIATTVDFNAAINDGAVYDGFQLKGTLRGFSNSDAQGYYILQSGNVWGKVTSDHLDVYIPPFRAYITSATPSNARLYSSIHNGTSDIQHIQTIDADSTVRWYDLNGRSIPQPTKKGLYIRNGKKILVNNE